MNPFPAERPKRRAIRCEPVGDDTLRLDRLAAKQLLQQFQCCARVAPFLNDEIENFAFIVNSAPQEHALAASLAGCTVINARPGDETQSLRHTTRFQAQIEFGGEAVEVRPLPLATHADHLAPQGRAFATTEPPAIILGNSDAKQQLGRGPYVVQIAAYLSEKRARATWSDLERRTPSLFKDVMRIVERADGGSIGTVYRLRAGYFSDASEANAFCILLDLAGNECMVVRMGPLGR